MKYIKIIFIYSSFLLVSPAVYGGINPTGEVSGASAGGGAMCGPNNVPQQAGPSGGTCQQHKDRIEQSCSENQTFQQGMQRRNTIPQVNSGDAQTTGSLQTAKTGMGAGTNACNDVGKALGQCRGAGEACEEICDKEIKQHQENAKIAYQARQSAKGDSEIDQANEKNEMKSHCKTEVAKSEKKMGASMQDIAQLMQALASLISALGGDDSGAEDLVAASDEEEDPCEGANASLLLECSGQSDPIGTRAGLGGTGVGGLSSGSGSSLLGQAAEADPGGDSNGNSKAAGSGFQNNGLGGGFGNSGFPGSGVSAASAGKEKIDADIYKGYMGGGGSGGMGSFGGGGGGGRSGRSSSSPFRSASSNRKKLQSALDRVASAGSRAPASVGGTNGPYQNIWGVVTKTYKKTSPSMFHKE